MKLRNISVAFLQIFGGKQAHLVRYRRGEYLDAGLPLTKRNICRLISWAVKYALRWYAAPSFWTVLLADLNASLTYEMSGSNSSVSVSQI